MYDYVRPKTLMKYPHGKYKYKRTLLIVNKLLSMN